MLHQFINDTKTFLLKSDIPLHELEVRRVEDSAMNLELGFAEFVGRSAIRSNPMFHTMVFFSLLDATVDATNPANQGRSLSRKYQSLPYVTDHEVVTAESYRILKVIRNCAVHHPDAFTTTRDKISISYMFNRTTYELEMDLLGLELIYSFLLDAYCPNTNPQAYKDGVMRSLYDDIKRRITRFSDESGHTLRSISNGIRIRRGVRYQVLNPLYRASGEAVQITSEFALTSSQRLHSAVEYRFDYCRNTYIVPEEVIADGGAIAKTDLPRWRI